jgi:malonate transporter and related proteins
MAEHDSALAQHYGIAPLRVSAAILLLTAASVMTVAGLVA